MKTDLFILALATAAFRTEPSMSDRPSMVHCIPVREPSS